MFSTYSLEVAAAFDAVADRYDECYSTRADEAENAIVFGQVDRKAGAGLFVDLGCGPGTAIPWLDVEPGRYLGADISAGMIAAAREAYPDRWFIYGNEDSLPDEQAGFLLGAFGPVQHVEDLIRFARRVREVLMPGGRFLVMGRPRQAKTRVLGSEALTRPYSAAEHAQAWWWARDLRIWGLRCFCPRWLPASLQIRWLAWETMLPPDWCDWIVVQGQR